MVERPEGMKIASFFIATIIITSLISRVARSTELRVKGVEPDAAATHFIDTAARFGAIRIIANRPDKGDRAEYENKLSEARDTHHLAPDEPVLFLEVRPGDASEFSEVLQVRRGGGGGIPRPALPEPGDSERDRGAAALHPRHHRA